MFKVIKTEGDARRGELVTVHGTVQTPVFMNVGTAAAIKGAVSSYDLRELGTQIELCNTYHLHLRPGSELIHKLGGLRPFMGWNGPVLTDSGGFQVFSLSPLRTIKEEGVYFSSYLDGAKIFMGPEESMQIQSNLGSTIAMAFDECIQLPAEYDYVKQSCDRTYRWLVRCKAEMDQLNQLPDRTNPHQMLFGINQGGTYHDIRIEHAKKITQLNLDGYAIGGLAVGESHQEMYETISVLNDYLPKDKPRYLMGVGTPGNIIEGVYRGVDMFDCVMPSRNARHGHLFTWEGIRNINNAKYFDDTRPIDKTCNCPVCQKFSRAYIRHLFKSKEMLGQRLAVMHNLYFYNTLAAKIREALDNGTFKQFHDKYV